MPPRRKFRRSKYSHIKRRNKSFLSKSLYYNKKRRAKVRKSIKRKKTYKKVKWTQQNKWKSQKFIQEEDSIVNGVSWLGTTTNPWTVLSVNAEFAGLLINIPNIRFKVVGFKVEYQDYTNKYANPGNAQLGFITQHKWGGFTPVFPMTQNPTVHPMSYVSHWNSQPFIKHHNWDVKSSTKKYYCNVRNWLKWWNGTEVLSDVNPNKYWAISNSSWYPPPNANCQILGGQIGPYYNSMVVFNAVPTLANYCIGHHRYTVYVKYRQLDNQALTIDLKQRLTDYTKKHEKDDKEKPSFNWIENEIEEQKIQDEVFDICDKMDKTNLNLKTLTNKLKNKLN